MSDATVPRTTVSTTGSVSVRQRPSLLLMKVRPRSAEATLELALAKLKKQAAETVLWLRRLGADRIDVGEPHLVEHADKDAMQKMRADHVRLMGQRRGAEPGEVPKREVMLVVTALWPIAALSAEETLLLVDRLRFEAIEDTDAPEAPDELPAWASPEEQMQEMMKQLHEPPPDDFSPQFLFIARLDDDQLAKAGAEAFAHARHSAEQLARAADMRLGRLSMMHTTLGGSAVGRSDKMMDRQRCLAILAGCSYDLKDDEMVSDDARAAEFLVSVNVSFHLE